MKQRRGRGWLIAFVAVLLFLLSVRPVFGALADITGHWSAAVVMALAAKGIVQGDLSGRFWPETSLTRAEFAKLMVIGLGNRAEAELLAGYDSRFHDINDRFWAKGYIESLAESGLTVGYGNGQFGPEDLVTRSQMALFLVRAAGMTERAAGLQFQATLYADDATLPDWARGAINAALAVGLMEGFEDGRFLPMAPITRAEGSTALFRLIQLKGSVFHLAGSLVRFDPARMQGTVRDDLGGERRFTMDKEAQFYRGGLLVIPQMVRVLDQVWIVLGENGLGRFLEARYDDVTGQDLKVLEQTVSLTTVDGSSISLTVQSGALIFVNGRPSVLPQADGSGQVYAALDRVTGEVRLLDAVNAPVVGLLVGSDLASRLLFVVLEGSPKEFKVAPEAVLFRAGERIELNQLTELEHETMLRFAVDVDGVITYLQVEE